MKLIVGLGNPGAEYAATPHNVGFRVADAIAAEHSAAWRTEAKFQGAVARAKVCGLELALLKPTTFMNLSGDSAGRLARYFGIEPVDVTVVSDDADLPLGRLRVRADGGSGGHRGLQSVIEALGSAFARVRVGVGRSQNGAGLRDFVLSRLSPEEEETLGKAEKRAAQAAICVATRGVDEAMNIYNAPEAMVAEGNKE